jgi:hypothetical protein
MADDGRSRRDPSSKVHPLFAKLYLMDDPDADESAGRPARKHGRVARKLILRNVARGGHAA